MLGRVLAVSLAALIVAACGGSTPTAAPSSSAVPSSAASAATPTVAPVAGPSATPGTAMPLTLTAACSAIGLRKTPSTKGALAARISTGATVRAVEIVTGDTYTVTACGSSGSTWYKIDEVNGNTTQSLYGVPFVYSASGLYR